MVNPERCMPQEPRSLPDEYFDTLKSRMPQLAALFDILASGVTPNFLDIMAAISEMVAFYTNCDQTEADHLEKIFAMSGKYCRFCS